MQGAKLYKHFADDCTSLANGMKKADDREAFLESLKLWR